MKCEVCGSETPPHYQHIGAWICHTCKSLGRMIEGLVVESKPPTPEIEELKTVEAVQPAEAPDTAAQIVDQEPAGSGESEQPAVTEPENEDPTPTTPPGTNKKKTAKLKT